MRYTEDALVELWRTLEDSGESLMVVFEFLAVVLRNSNINSNQCDDARWFSIFTNIIICSVNVCHFETSFKLRNQLQEFLGYFCLL